MKRNINLHIGVWIALMILFAGYFYNDVNKIAISIIIGIIIFIYVIFILWNLYVNSNLKRKKVFLSGPYNGSDGQVKQNILKAISAARKLRNQGFNVFLPHSSLVYCEDLEQSEQGRREIILLCKEWIEACDLFAIMPGWQDSNGAREEYNYALSIGKEIIHLT